MADHKVTVEIKSGAKKKKKPGEAGGPKPSANPDGGAKPQLNPAATTGTNPMTTQAAAPIQGANPGGSPAGVITPTPTQDVRQVRENINFRDMPPPAQAQVMGQQGIDMDQPRQQLEQSAQGAVQGGPGQGPVPNALVGPMIPPGVESLPADYAHLSQLMQQGFAPGANPAEHALGQNAQALHRAFADAQEMEPVGPPQQMTPGAGPEPSSQLAPGAPPMQPGAPGGIPPELIQQLMAEAERKKRSGGMR